MISKKQFEPIFEEFIRREAADIEGMIDRSLGKGETKVRVACGVRSPTLALLKNRYAEGGWVLECFPEENGDDTLTLS